MPARYDIDKKRRLVINTGWDRLTLAEMRAQQEQLTADPDFDPSFDQLVDITAVTELAMSTEEAIAVARRGLYLPTSRRAVIASGPAIFGVARMMDVHHSMSTGREQVAVFYDRAAALKWLGLDDYPDH